MVGEIFEVVAVPYKSKRRNIAGRIVYYNNYVAYCGCCGNPIDPYTSRRYCRFCRNTTKWRNDINPRRYKLHDDAIKKTCNRI